MEKSKIIEIILIFLIGFLIGFYIQLDLYPTKTNMQPSNYFQNLTENSVIQLDQFRVYQMLDTPSMLPTLPYNSYLLTKEDLDYSIGDIIVINLPEDSLDRYKNQPSAHRIIKIKENDQKLYLTRGDNMKFNDGIWWNESQIYGKVIGVLY